MNFIVIILGVIIGSFLNVCIYRIPNKESVVTPSSHCPLCGYYIKWYENIPIFSYIFILGGKCSNCKKKISIEYPIVEGLTGSLFLLFYIRFGFTYLTIEYIIVICLLIVGSGVDLKHYYIPDRVTLSMLLIGIITSFFYFGFEKSILGAGVFSLFYALLYGYGESIGKEIMGFGDVKLAMGIGSIVGYNNLYQLFLFLEISFILGAAIGLILILLKLKTRKDTIPFGPYIAISGLIMIFINK